jgi:hypothetical protein
MAIMSSSSGGAACSCPDSTLFEAARVGGAPIEAPWDRWVDLRVIECGTKPLESAACPVYVGVRARTMSAWRQRAPVGCPDESLASPARSNALDTARHTRMLMKRVRFCLLGGTPWFTPIHYEGLPAGIACQLLTQPISIAHVQPQ